jgi:hypothetical protein
MKSSLKKAFGTGKEYSLYPSSKKRGSKQLVDIKEELNEEDYLSLIDKKEKFISKDTINTNPTVAITTSIIICNNKDSATLENADQT